MVYNAGIIGLGKIGVGSDGRPDNHLSAYQKCKDVKVVALSDIDESGAIRARLQNKADGIWYPQPYFMNLLKDGRLRLDIVSVCTPPDTHCQIVCDIAPYVKAILCEKPIALTLEDADMMIATCHKYGTILQINHQRAFMIPKFRFSRGIINTGTHMFQLLTQLFGKLRHDKDNIWMGDNTEIEIEYVDTDEHIFEFEVLHTKEPMIQRSIESLIRSLKNGWDSVCSGEDGREALRLALEFGELNNISPKRIYWPYEVPGKGRGIFYERNLNEQISPPDNRGTGHPNNS